MPVLTATERVGTLLAGKYRLDHILGRGGFGTVYAGVHTWTDREIAVKVLNHEYTERVEIVQRFLQEAKAAARLKHRHVVDVLDMGREEDGTVYLVLERLHGQELADLLETRGTLPLPQALSILLPVMHALAKAHEAGITHRDLKPQNIFLHTNSEGELVPKVLDFGIAKMATGANHATRTGLLMGTPQFMSPEQAHGATDVGPPADVWSMAVVLWRALAGSLPFDGETPTAVLTQVVTRPAVPFAQVAPHFEGPIATCIDRALAHQPAYRYPHMRAFLDDLRGAAAAVGLTPGAPASADFPLPDASGTRPIGQSSGASFVGRTPSGHSAQSGAFGPPPGATPVSAPMVSSGAGWATPAPGGGTPWPSQTDSQLVAPRSRLWMPIMLFGVLLASIGVGSFGYLAWTLSASEPEPAPVAEPTEPTPALPVAEDPPEPGEEAATPTEPEVEEPVEEPAEPQASAAAEAEPTRSRRRRRRRVEEGPTEAAPAAEPTAPTAAEPTAAQREPARAPARRTTNDVPVIR